MNATIALCPKCGQKTVFKRDDDIGQTVFNFTCGVCGKSITRADLIAHNLNLMNRIEFGALRERINGTLHIEP